MSIVYYKDDGPARPTYSEKEKQARIRRAAYALRWGTPVQCLEERGLSPSEIAQAYRLIGRTPRSRDINPASRANLQNGRR